VVARIGWRVDTWETNYTQFHPNRRDVPYGEDRRFVPVAAFADRGAAEAHMRALELEAARLFNPFWLVSPFRYLTESPEPTFRRRLAALAGNVPADQLTVAPRPGWREWWDDNLPTWSDETLAAVWELFDSVRFYDVLELDVR
jgi:hypothetical protein